MAKGRPLPQWYQDEPPAGPMDDIFIGGFNHLTTERRYEHGPIPHGVIVDYAVKIGLEDDVADMFVRVLHEMDVAYLQWSAEELDRQRQQKRASRPTKK